MMVCDRYASFEAFSSDAVVGVDEPGALTAACAEVQRTVAEFDRACSRFRDDSELTAVNEGAGTAVPVGPVLLEAVAEALRAARVTDGDVDPTVGRALIALGYDRDFAAMRDGDWGSSRGDGRSISIVSAPGWRSVRVDADAGTIRVARGVRLDLGAAAKALAADHAARDASAVAGCGVLVSFGGDIATAGAPPAEGWRVRVTDDHRAGVDAPGQWITLRSGGLATSSTTVRRWRTESGAVHHLIDPTTGRPADSVWRTVSVAAGSCLDANIASTASIIRGERATAWLDSLGLPSRLVGVDGSVLHVAGWPDEGDDLAPGDLAHGSRVA
jgi:thiamine biosynthesis lipoprotein